MLIAFSQMKEATVQGLGHRLGRFADIVFDGNDWVIRYVAIDTGHWLPGHEIPLRPTELTELNWTSLTVKASVTKEEAESGTRLPFPEPIARHMEKELSRYYQLPLYWSVDPIYNAPVPELHLSPEKTAEIEALQLNVRSATEIHNYDIHASDGNFGTVHDLVIDDDYWVVRYIIVDTGHWLPGRKVVLSTSWIDRISWTERALFVDLSKAEVEAAPEYDAREVVNRDYEQKLFDHHGRPAYWGPTATK